MIIKYFITLFSCSSLALMGGQAQIVQQLPTQQATTPQSPLVKSTSRVCALTTLATIEEAPHEEQAAKDRKAYEQEQQKKEITGTVSALFYESLEHYSYLDRPTPLVCINQIFEFFFTRVLDSCDSQKLMPMFSTTGDLRTLMHEYFYSKALAHNQRIINSRKQDYEEELTDPTSAPQQEQKIFYEACMKNKPKTVAVTQEQFLLVHGANKTLSISTIEATKSNPKIKQCYTIPAVEQFFLTPDEKTLIFESKKATHLLELATNSSCKPYPNITPERLSPDGKILFGLDTKRKTLVRISIADKTVTRSSLPQPVTFIFPLSSSEDCSYTSIGNSTDPQKVSFTITTITCTSSPESTSKLYTKQFPASPALKITNDHQSYLAACDKRILYSSLENRFSPLPLVLDSNIELFDTSPDCRYLVVKNTQQKLSLFNLEFGTLITTIDKVATYFLNLTNSSLFVASCSGTIAQYHLPSGVVLKTFKPTENKLEVFPVRLIGLYVNPDNQYLTSCITDPITTNSLITVWQLASRKDSGKL